MRNHSALPQQANSKELHKKPCYAKSSAASVGRIQSKGFNSDSRDGSAWRSELVARALETESGITISHVLFGSFSYEEKEHHQNISITVSLNS
jgi:hypothetical protein